MSESGKHALSVGADAAGDNPKKVVCLNCGTVCTGSFCSHCGQPTRTDERLTFRTFPKDVAAGIANFTPGFLTTFVGLIVHPWVVIREYIQGKRVKYAPPVTMVMQLILYISVITVLINHIFGLNIDMNDVMFRLSISIENPEGDAEKIMGLDWLLMWIFQSNVFQYLVTSIPVAFCCYLAYFKFGSRRFNFIEYMVAAIYMSCSLTIYAFLLIPVQLVNENAGALFNALAVIIVSALSLMKAFPIKAVWKRCLALLFFGLLNIGWVVLLFAIIILLG